MRRLSELNMALIKEELARLLRLLDKMENPQRDMSAPVDIWMNEDEVVIRFNLPGADQTTLKVYGTRTHLEIAGVRPPVKPPEGGRFLMAERSVGPFHRSVELPAPVDLCNAKAVYQHGVMTVIIPRVVDRRQNSHHIPFTIEE